MSGHLALVGGGEFTEGCTFDAALLEASGASEVLVAPTAAAYEHPQRLVERAVGWFDRLGVPARGLDLLARPDASAPAVVDALAKGDPRWLTQHEDVLIFKRPGAPEPATGAGAE